MQVPVYNKEGKKVSTLELNKDIFGVSPKTAMLHEVVVAQRANARVAIAHTKRRGDVSGGGKKPWKQKGTGRARQGSIRSPQWKGGGVVFGPRSNRNFSKKLNVKMRRLAIRMALSDKAASGAMVIVDAFTVANNKTKEAAGILKALPLKRGTTMLALARTEKNAGALARNISGVTPMWAGSLNVVDLLKYANFVTTLEGLKEIEQLYKPKA